MQGFEEDEGPEDLPKCNCLSSRCLKMYCNCFKHGAAQLVSTCSMAKRPAGVTVWLQAASGKLIAEPFHTVRTITSYIMNACNGNQACLCVCILGSVNGLAWIQWCLCAHLPHACKPQLDSMVLMATEQVCGKFIA
jgi:hypothetical protein